MPAPHSGLSHVGSVLRQAREDQALSLPQLAGLLHMGDEQLAALESGNRANLPETVFIKAMVRRVASKLGIDADPLVIGLQSLDFEDGLGAKTSKPFRHQTATESGAAPAAPKRRRPTVRLFTTLAAIAAAGAAAFNIERLAPFVQRWTTGGQPAPSPSQASAHTKAAETTPATRQDNRATSVTVSTREPSWMVIRDHAGTVLFEGTLDNSKTLRSEGDLEIYPGRPDLVRVSREGQDRPSQALGPIGQVRWYRITAAPSRPDQAL